LIVETRHLIDAIVQQTTLLIAQLATSAGIRAPLANIADQVFLDLANEIEQQGVTREVVADMFGIALRTYQKKVNRLRESVTETEQTLWQTVLSYVREHDGATRRQVLAAFARDDERHVIAVLNDLVAGGLLYATGRGQHAAYGPTPDHNQRAMLQEQGLDTRLHLLWLEIADHPGVSRDELRKRFGDRVELVDQALATLLADHRVRAEGPAGEERFHTQRLLIPVGSEAGWETAVFDHFRAVCTAIAGKLREGGPGSDKHHLIGGSTLCFDIQSGHPCEDEVKALLGHFREQAFALWNRVSKLNQASPIAEASRIKVVFYFGQNVIRANAEEPGA
jgi:hypothetical protein